MFLPNFLGINPHNLAKTHQIFENKGLLHAKFYRAYINVFFKNICQVAPEIFEF